MYSAIHIAQTTHKAPNYYKSLKKQIEIKIVSWNRKKSEAKTLKKVKEEAP